MSPNCGHQRAHCLSPRRCMSMDSHGGMILTGETEELGEEPVPVPLNPSQSNTDDRSANLGVGGERRRQTA
jgi:hypothetical protein